MNNESNQNTRTLIVSFVFAVMALIPLRFIEVGQSFSNSAVLGETIVNNSVEIKKVSDSELEAPYQEIEDGTYVKEDCLSKVDGQLVIDQLTSKIDATKMSFDEIETIVNQVKEIELKLCQD